MIRWALTISAVLILAACGGKSPTSTKSWDENDERVIITNNGGGNVQAFLSERSRLKASGKPIILRGYCGSACTVLYSLPNTCMAKGSSLHFHGSSSPLPVGEGITNRRMAATYRAGIKEGFLREWQHLTMPMHRVPRAEAKRLDPQIKFCKE